MKGKEKEKWRVGMGRLRKEGRGGKEGSRRAYTHQYDEILVWRSLIHRILKY